MSYTVSHQKPGSLDPVHLIPIVGEYDPVPAIKKAMVSPVYAPLGSSKAVVLDDTGQVVKKAQFLDTVLSCLGDTVNTLANDIVKGVYQQALVHYDARNVRLVNEAFVVQAAGRQKLPAPGNRVIYSVQSDVLPAAKKVLSGSGSPEELFVSIAYLYAPQTVGFWFLDAPAFDDFRAWFDAETQNLAGVLPGDTKTLVDRFVNHYSIKGTIADGLVLRKDDQSGNDEYSFPRVLMNLLMQYEQQQTTNNVATGAPITMGVMPFSVSELFLPRTVVFANVEAHARASDTKVDAAWKLVRASLNLPVRVVSNKALSRLTALPRAIAKASASANYGRTKNPAGRSAQVKFRKQPPSVVDVLTGTIRVLQRMKKVNYSQNPLKQVKQSYSRANRRDPDDYNKTGKVVSTKYLPDLHIFLDTSGSISESNYQSSVIMLIKLAKKMGVNLYFNSFSDVLSQEVMLRTAGKSTTQIWKEFRRIPKVTGGTDFHQVWDYIELSQKRKQRMSLMITDFGYYPPTQAVVHPKNLYYAPCANMSWKVINRYAHDFTSGMRHIEPAIARRLIGMTQ